VVVLTGQSEYANADLTKETEMISQIPLNYEKARQNPNEIGGSSRVNSRHMLINDQSQFGSISVDKGSNPLQAHAAETMDQYSYSPVKKIKARHSFKNQCTDGEHTVNSKVMLTN